MSVPTLGLLTIGQSPRPDMTGTYSGLGAHILEAGALDGLSAAEVARDVAPTSEDVVADRTVYVTRLRDGGEVKVLKGHVTEGLQQRLDEMGPRGDLLGESLVLPSPSGLSTRWSSREPLGDALFVGISVKINLQY
jgi:hypothetical protein